MKGNTQDLNQNSMMKLKLSAVFFMVKFFFQKKQIQKIYYQFSTCITLIECGEKKQNLSTIEKNF